jgi:hypothetical protein
MAAAQQLTIQIMQPAQLPFQPVGQAMQGANMGMPEPMPHFLQHKHHMLHSGHVLPATEAVLPGEYMPMVDSIGRLAGWVFCIRHPNSLIGTAIGKPVGDVVMLPISYTVCDSLLYFDLHIWNASRSQ